jgi:hypothetical protein
VGELGFAKYIARLKSSDTYGEASDLDAEEAYESAADDIDDYVSDEMNQEEAE